MIVDNPFTSVKEAEKKYQALQRLVLSIEDDKELSAARFMHYAEGRIIKESEKFRKRYFAIRDKKKHQAAENEGINNPSEESICDIRDICVTNKLSAGQTKILDTIKSHPDLWVPGISDETGIPAKSIEPH